MTTSPTSYLQTLPKDEAIAFVASLQKVKIHLSQELAWVSQQAQQKTVQLQGIETLLSEAAILGLVDTSADSAASTTEPTTVTDASTVVAIADVAANGNSAAALPVVPAATNPNPVSNGDAAPTTPNASAASDVAPPPPAKTSTRGKRGAQPTKKKGTAPAAKAKPASSSKASALNRESTQPFVKSQFQDQSITDAIGDILKRSRSPLSADDIMATLYEGLSDEAYKRAKNSVTNILSVGRAKGKWKSTGRGLYANNVVAG